MASITGRQKEQRRGGVKMPAAIRCNTIKGGISWRNRKFTVPVCGATAKKAAENVKEADYRPVIERAADTAIALDCTPGEGCGDTQRCLPGDIDCTIVITQGAVDTRCRPTGLQDGCPDGQTRWQCDIFANVDAEKTCGCRVP